ncbi:MAG: hypothetical protein J6Q80_02145 [Lentisphaeria bacterium]|nr:hypothetical protein [Lentisphaeria bacterium]
MSNQRRETVRGYYNRVREALCGTGLLYDCINEYESSWLPGRLNSPNSVYFHYFFRYLLQDLYSIFDFRGVPEDWQKEYMIYNLLCRGWIAFVRAEPYGWIPQPCTWGGERSVFAFPLTVLVCNGWFNPDDGRIEYRLDQDAYYLHTAPDFAPLADICAFYADKLSCLFSTLNNSAILSRNGYILTTDNKAKSMTLEKAIEGVLNSEFIVSMNARREPGGSISDSVEILETDVRKHYIVDQVLLDIENLVDQFHADIGFPVINRTKKERVQTMEQASLNASSFGKSENWFDVLQEDLERFNAASGLSITLGRREPDEANEVIQESVAGLEPEAGETTEEVKQTKAGVYGLGRRK